MRSIGIYGEVYFQMSDQLDAWSGIEAWFGIDGDLACTSQSANNTINLKQLSLHYGIS